MGPPWQKFKNHLIKGIGKTKLMLTTLTLSHWKEGLNHPNDSSPAERLYIPLSPNTGNTR